MPVRRQNPLSEIKIFPYPYKFLHRWKIKWLFFVIFILRQLLRPILALHHFKCKHYPTYATSDGMIFIAPGVGFPWTKNPGQVHLFFQIDMDSSKKLIRPVLNFCLVFWFHSDTICLASQNKSLKYGGSLFLKQRFWVISRNLSLLIRSFNL